MYKPVFDDGIAVLGRIMLFEIAFRDEL